MFIQNCYRSINPSEFSLDQTLWRIAVSITHFNPVNEQTNQVVHVDPD